MTANEIIIANKMCAMPTNILCEECPYHHLRDTDSDCVEVMTNDTIDLIEGLINGQITLQKALAQAEAKVESKSAVMEIMARCIETQENEIERLNVGLDNAMKFHSEAAAERDSAKAEISHLKKLLSESEAKFNEAAKRFYKEGVRDFKKRLENVYASDKRYNRPNPHTMLSMLFYNICTVAKELTGDAE